MARIAGITTQKNKIGIVTKITIDLKKHPQAEQPLKELGLIAKSEEEIYREEFYKKMNDPSNLTLDQLQESMLKHIDSLPWKKL